MNRENRRKMAKKDKTLAKILQQNKELNEQHVSCFEGEKVKINYEQIKNSKDWDKLNLKYKEFIETHKDEIFTVEFDPIKKELNAKTKDLLVQLKEDETKPKWLFQARDLIPLPGQVKPKDKEEEYKEYINNFIENLENKIKEGK